jgi:uncharacterized membrane protein YphA (DoxX/SURF4 family)
MATETTTHANYNDQKTSAAARLIPTIARTLMGLIFSVFGLNGFLHFIPNHQVLSAGAMAFFGALAQTGYMLPLIFATELLAGVLLLVNRFVPLALALIAPVVVNIIAFHLFLDRPHLAGPGVIVAIAEVYLAWAYRSAFAPMLAARMTPTSSKRA